MDYIVPKGISDIKPKDGMALREYLDKIKEENRIQDYYAYYGTELLESTKINYYAENNINLLSVEFPDINAKEEEKEKSREKLIIAKKEGNVGSVLAIKKIFDEFFNKNKMYSTKELIGAEQYVARLSKLGWEFTPEGLDFMQVTQLDELVAIRRTEFTENEFKTLTPDDITQNRRNHIERVERELIDGIEEYLIESYVNLPDDEISSEVRKYKDKVLRYDFHKKAETENKDKGSDLLKSILQNIKPIKEKTQIATPMEKILSQELAKYLDMIPEEYRDNVKYTFIRRYTLTRDHAINERENGELKEGSESEKLLENLVKSIDSIAEQSLSTKRELLTAKSDKIVKDTTYVRDGEEI